MRIDPRADSCAADGEFEDRRDCELGATDGEFDLPGKAAELLAESQGGRIGEMGSPDLDDLVPLLGLISEHRMEPLQSGDQLGVNRQRDGDMDRGRERVVRALPHVDMVVGVDRFGGFEPVAPREFDRAVGDDLVGVHVARCPRSGLEDIDRELVVELPGCNLLSGLQHEVDLLRSELDLARVL